MILSRDRERNLKIELISYLTGKVSFRYFSTTTIHHIFASNARIEWFDLFPPYEEGIINEDL